MGLGRRGPDDGVDHDQLLSNVMLYWLTGTAGSSADLYYENAHAGSWAQQPGTTPTGVAVFASDHAIRPLRRAWQQHRPLDQFDHGGHFAAMETPTS
jgi:epoxide hydrolase